MAVASASAEAYRFIHPVLAERAPDLLSAVVGAHDVDDGEIDALETRFAAARAAMPAPGFAGVWAAAERSLAEPARKRLAHVLGAERERTASWTRAWCSGTKRSTRYGFCGFCWFCEGLVFWDEPVNQVRVLLVLRVRVLLALRGLGVLGRNGQPGTGSIIGSREADEAGERFRPTNTTGRSLIEPRSLMLTMADGANFPEHRVLNMNSRVERSRMPCRVSSSSASSSSASSSSSSSITCSSGSSSSKGFRA